MQALVSAWYSQQPRDAGLGTFAWLGSPLGGWVPRPAPLDFPAGSGCRTGTARFRSVLLLPRHAKVLLPQKPRLRQLRWTGYFHGRLRRRLQPDGGGRPHRRRRRVSAIPVSDSGAFGSRPGVDWRRAFPFHRIFSQSPATSSSGFPLHIIRDTHRTAPVGRLGDNTWIVNRFLSF